MAKKIPSRALSPPPLLFLAFLISSSLLSSFLHPILSRWHGPGQKPPGPIFKPRPVKLKPQAAAPFPTLAPPSLPRRCRGPAMTARGVNQEPFSRFADFVAETKVKHKGQDLAGNSKDYIPLSALRGYWTPRCISRVLHAFPDSLDINVDIIRRKYLRLFSTLVYADPDAVRNLQRLFISRDLSDDSLPWRARPSVWPDEKFYRDFFKLIWQNQWQFFPFDFTRDKLHDLHIADEYILPIDSPSTIAQGSAAIVERIEIHSEYNHLATRDQDDHPIERSFVFKVYHNRKYEDYYENELRALQRLSVDQSPNVVKFFGSFRQHGSYCLVLEFVNGGDLGEFFAKQAQPSTVEDVVLFWKSLFQVFNGLERIHQLMSYNRDELIKGIHEDIRPENILLMKGPSGSPYDFIPKIADFGLYSRVRTAKAQSSGSMGMDHYGNQRFSSPECCHHTIQRHKGTNMITTSADIFSMGAVLSHTAAWVVGGSKQQTAYFQSRKAYHDKEMSRFTYSGYEGCFHNSIEPLPIIAQEHRKLRQGCQLQDDITPEVLKWIEEHMLIQPPKSRSRARDILERFEQFIERRQRSLLPSPSADHPVSPEESPASPDQSPFWSENLPSTSTVDGVSLQLETPIASILEPCRPSLRITVSRQSVTEAESQPQLQRDDSRLTTDNVLSTVNQPSSEGSRSSSSHNRQPNTSRGTSASRSPISSIAHHIGVSQIHEFKSAVSQGKPVDKDTALLVEYLEHNLHGRDQFFFIDDSHSMLPDKQTIYDGFRALACIAKKLDPNKVELAFASRPRKVYKAKRIKRLRDLVAKCQYMGEAGLMEDRIGELIDNVIIPYLPYKIFGVNVNLLSRKKVSVYVFTDGDWGHASSSGDACGVERPVKRLIEELKKRRLDRTQVSLHFVRFGDKDNGRLHLERLDDFGKVDGWDIVDVKHIGGGVAGMMLGPLTRENDDSPGG